MKTITLLHNSTKLLIWSLLILGVSVQAQNTKGSINSVDAQLSDQDITIRLTTQGSIGKPTGFVMTNPNRIVLSFDQVDNATGSSSHSFNLRYLRDMQIAKANKRLRLVINVDTRVKYELKSANNQTYIVIRPYSSTASNIKQKYPSSYRDSSQDARVLYTQTSVKDVRFRRGEKGEGKLIITLSSEELVPDITQRGDGVLLHLKDTSIPVRLRQNLDVLDFATPVKNIKISQNGNTGKIQVLTKGLWEYSSYQLNNVLIVEIVPVQYDPNKLVQGNQKEYKGEKLSLNFQNIDIRSIFQVIADFRDINIITSDSVGGSITLRLKDVPWDQALDLIMESKDLGMEKNGNVVHVAPKAELAAKKKLDLQQQNQIDDLQPLRTEVFKIKYHKASAIRNILQERTHDRINTLLSGRGSAVQDTRTNSLIVNDTPDTLQRVRELLTIIDIPLPQVMIEARIVSTTNSFSESFKPRLALLRPGGGTTPNHAFQLRSTNLATTVGGNLNSAVGAITAPNSSTDGFVNFVDGANPGKIGFAIFDKSLNTVLGLELDALETEGRSKTISNPRVITQTNKAATITSGVKVPYQSATESGATATSFIDATLSLNVTPQITPDGKVLLKLTVNDSSPADGGQVNTKAITTEVLVENGGTLVIGGIYVQAKGQEELRVPFFSSLPIIGRFFRSNTDNDSKSEFLVFITPRILAEGGVSFSN